MVELNQDLHQIQAQEVIKGQHQVFQIYLPQVAEVEQDQEQEVMQHNLEDQAVVLVPSFLVVEVETHHPFHPLKEIQEALDHQDNYLVEVAEPQVEEVVQVARQAGLADQVLQLQYLLIHQLLQVEAGVVTDLVVGLADPVVEAKVQVHKEVLQTQVQETQVAEADRVLLLLAFHL